MGKNSLLKSTSKAKKKATAKKKAAAKVKAAPKAKALPKAKKATAAKTKKTAPKAPKKKVSVKDLIMKKFDVWKPETLFTVSPDKTDSKDFIAPPFFSGPEEEIRRIKELLLKKFDLAEIKAAGEKAAAEKAAAEKAAAEKAAAEKAAAEKAAAEPEVSVSYEPPDSGDTSTDDPMEKAMKYMAAAFALLIALVIGSSMINKNKFYIHATDGALEIWQGRFAPMGEACLISLPGVQPPEIIKNIYSKAAAFPLIFNFYVEKADTLLNVPGLPDFEGIKTYLNKALGYATTPAANEAVFSRLNNIELMILLYKADVSASKPTISDLNQAKGYLSEAARLDIDDLKIDLVHQKMDAVDQQIAALKAKKAAKKSPAKPSK
jgi:colicin import membrane protein